MLPCIILGGRKGMRNYSTCNTQIVVLSAGPLFQCFKFLLSSEGKAFALTLMFTVEFPPTETHL